MGPGYFVIAILGCADGGSSCTQVATIQTRYETQAQCTAATPAVLEANSDFDFPTLLARCRSGAGSNRAEAKPDGRIPANARRG